MQKSHLQLICTKTRKPVTIVPKEAAIPARRFSVSGTGNLGRTSRDINEAIWDFFENTEEVINLYWFAEHCEPNNRNLSLQIRNYYIILIITGTIISNRNNRNPGYFPYFAGHCLCN